MSSENSFRVCPMCSGGEVSEPPFSSFKGPLLSRGFEKAKCDAGGWRNFPLGRYPGIAGQTTVRECHGRPTQSNFAAMASGKKRRQERSEAPARGGCGC